MELEKSFLKSAEKKAADAASAMKAKQQFDEALMSDIYRSNQS